MFSKMANETVDSLVLVLMQPRYKYKHKHEKNELGPSSSAYVYTFVAGVLTCLIGVSVYSSAYAYVLMKTGL